MVADDQVGTAGIGAADIFENPLADFEQKRAGAAGEIEHRDTAVVGETVDDAETVLQNIVNRADDG